MAETPLMIRESRSCERGFYQTVIGWDNENPIGKEKVVGTPFLPD
jgi:hypothetical protein